MSTGEKQELGLPPQNLQDGLVVSVLQDHSDSSSQERLQGVNERKLRWKIDLSILPLLGSVFFLAAIGQSNMGNAYQAGMAQDLSITPAQFVQINSLFIVGMVVAQLPGALLLRILGPPRQFAGAMVAWGLLTIGASYAKNYATLVVCRVLLASSESLIQGGLLYLSYWYKYEELATRAAALGATNSIAGAFGGLIAYAIQSHLNGRNGWKAWRWLFLIEGILPAGWAVVVFFGLPPTPESVRRGFSPKEKALLEQRAAESHNTGVNKIVPKHIPKVLLDPTFWLIALVQAGMLVSSNSTANFLPSIMAGLGYEGVRAQLMTAIPYGVAAVSNVALCLLSDWSRLRGVWILGGCVITGVGYIVLITTLNLPGRLVATCLITAGASAPATICFAWMASSHPGYTFRGSSIALMNIVCYLIALGGQQAFDDPPLYHKGEAVSLAFVFLSALLTAVLLVYLRWLNAKKRKQQHSEEAQSLRQFTVDDIGNNHPDFFFPY